MYSACYEWVTNNRCFVEEFNYDDADILSIFKDGVHTLLEAEAKCKQRSPYPAPVLTTKKVIKHLYKKLNAAVDEEYSTY